MISPSACAHVFFLIFQHGLADAGVPRPVAERYLLAVHPASSLGTRMISCEKEQGIAPPAAEPGADTKAEPRSQQTGHLRISGFPSNQRPTFNRYLVLVQRLLRCEIMSDSSKRISSLSIPWAATNTGTSAVL